ncbi:RHS repeat-associated core domain-containing protein [Pseudomonas sp. COR18]|uniref:RHS repeat-associated core domain-containing protein n=1 Tax=Pseudomonas sp. COR18 TaxID=3399680 RepID=UPI003AFF6917
MAILRTLLSQYRYDPLDRLVACSPVNLDPQQRFYCKSRLATEIQGAITHSFFQSDDWRMAQQRRQGADREATLLATDQQGSVLQAVDGVQRQAMAYSPYGHRTPGSVLLSLLSFNGEQPDPVTGHYLLGNGYRAFNPVLMRFNSPDSLSPFGAGELNVYAYCKGDSINKIDPTGRISFKLLSGIVVRLSEGMKRTPSFKRVQGVAGATMDNPRHLKELPDIVYREFVGYLGGDENVALALTEKGVKEKVYRNVKPVRLVNAARDSVNHIDNVREISLGKRGHLPVQVIGDENFRSDVYRLPANDNSPGRDYLWEVYDNARLTRRVRSIREEARISKEIRLARNREAYGEDYPSDSSYDSD